MATTSEVVHLPSETYYWVNPGAMRLVELGPRPGGVPVTLGEVSDLVRYRLRHDLVTRADHLRILPEGA